MQTTCKGIFGANLPELAWMEPARKIQEKPLARGVSAMERGGREAPIDPHV